MTTLQIAENLSAAGLDHPAVDDAVIKLTNAGNARRDMARDLPDVVIACLERYRGFDEWWGDIDEDDSNVILTDLQQRLADAIAHPSRGVVDEDVVARAVAAMNAVRSWNPDVKDDYVRKLARAALQAAALPAVPDGWKLVPIEPTERMVVDGFESAPNEFFSPPEVWEKHQQMSGCQQAAYRARLCYAAMLAAAPTPCPCGLATCVEPWEPGCGLGTVAEYARAATPAHDQPEGEG